MARLGLRTRILNALARATQRLKTGTSSSASSARVLLVALESGMMLLKEERSVATVDDDDDELYMKLFDFTRRLPSLSERRPSKEHGVVGVKHVRQASRFEIVPWSSRDLVTL